MTDKKVVDIAMLNTLKKEILDSVKASQAPLEAEIEELKAQALTGGETIITLIDEVAKLGSAAPAEFSKEKGYGFDVAKASEKPEPGIVYKHKEKTGYYIQVVAEQVGPKGQKVMRFKKGFVQKNNTIVWQEAVMDLGQFNDWISAKGEN